jgi:RNA polymerase sigma-70 factor (ECF subfamily)
VESSDESLCARAAGGDEAAFDTLVERYQQRAFRLAWSILRDPEEARDLSQEAFVRLYQTAGSFRGRSLFSTWFYRLLVNLCLDQQRKRRGWRQLVGLGNMGEDRAAVPALERVPAPGVDPVETLGRERQLARVWAAAASLSPQQRAVLTLHIQDELPMSEVAKVMGCAEATARVHLHRALASLRALVGKEET